MPAMFHLFHHHLPPSLLLRHIRCKLCIHHCSKVHTSHVITSLLQDIFFYKYTWFQLTPDIFGYAKFWCILAITGLIYIKPTFWKLLTIVISVTWCHKSVKKCRVFKTLYLHQCCIMKQVIFGYIACSYSVWITSVKWLENAHAVLG